VNLVIHPVTERQLEAFRHAPSHAVILSGPTGSGKLSLAKQLAEGLIDLPTGSLDNYAYKSLIRSAEGKAIGIEPIRELEHFLSLKVPGHKQLNRVVIIEDSHLLTVEAQNALLKTLEEPPEGTIIILTANREDAMLPTIRSRTTSINIRQPEKAALEAHFAQAVDLEKIYAVSGGLPGLMSALLDNDEHPLRSATGKARELLTKSAYERLLTVDELSKQRQAALNVLFILQNMAQVSLQSAAGVNSKRWQAILKAAYDAQTALERNAQPKLALTNLMLQL
jgi:DNA polymerase III delta prime subunit